jgi:8-oxo-dGTP pyrophosphatase MutT (NUDIX family)
MSQPKQLLPWKVLEEKPLVVRRWLEVHEQRIALGHGGVIDAFHLIKGPDWGGVLALTDASEIVLVRQYRHGYGGLSVELPAGVIEKGEAPLAAVQRELLEETGFSADGWQPLLSVQTEPTRHTTRAHFFLCTGARRIAEARLDAAEHLEAFVVPAAELFAMLERGEIVHAVHVAAILTAVQRGFLRG